MVAVDKGSAVMGAGFAQDSVNMVLNRVLGEVQAAGNLLVALSPTNQLDELLFAAAEFSTGACLQILAIDEMLRGMAEQRRRKAGGIHRLSGSYSADSIDHFCGGSFAEDESRGSLAHREQKIFLLRLHSHHDCAGLWEILTNETQHRMLRGRDSKRIKKDDLELACDHFLQRLRGISADPDDGHVSVLVENSNQSFTQQTIHTQQKHVHLIAGHKKSLPSAEIVFHSAAHKHVHLMEINPCEAVANNITSTRNLVEQPVASGVDRFVQVSTDKAVHPTSIMGASKQVCEMIVQSQGDRQRTLFCCVRFGNVLGAAEASSLYFSNRSSAEVRLRSRILRRRDS